MIVWLASFPRSGNTMVRILLHKVYGQLSYSLYEERPGEGFADMMGSAGQIAADSLEELRRQPEPCFVKTHGYPSDDSPALCLVRDGRDTLVSYAHFLLAHEPDVFGQYTFDEMLRRLVESTDFYGGWTANVLAWHERAASTPTVWLRYEDLVADPIGRLEAALSRLGIAVRLTGKPPVAFHELHSRWPNFFRRGRPAAWRNEMNSELCELFWCYHNEPMRRFGYGRTRRSWGYPGLPFRATTVTMSKRLTGRL
jgi:hypothetical protein